jgi:hypothetical protein
VEGKVVLARSLLCLNMIHSQSLRSLGRLTDVALRPVNPAPAQVIAFSGNGDVDRVLQVIHLSFLSIFSFAPQKHRPNLLLRRFMLTCCCGAVFS